MSTLNELSSFVQNVDGHITRLYLVTRTVKQDFSTRAMIPNKYEYTCYTINTNSSIQKELYSLFVENVIHYANKDEYIVENYSVVTDDAEKKILMYTSKEQISPFIHIVDIDLKNSIELTPVNNLADIANNLWAYIIEISLNDQIVCGLRKISSRKVLISKKGKTFAAKFSMKENSLVLSEEQSIIFDKKLDAIYAYDRFFIIQKNNFEQIVGLESEYRQTAVLAANKIKQSSQIKLNFDIIKEIENKNRFIRKLTKIKDEIDNIDANRIEKMKGTANSFDLHFVVESGKIVIDNEKELDVVIKLLDDYYLLSQQTGKRYEASVKKEI